MCNNTCVYYHIPVHVIVSDVIHMCCFMYNTYNTYCACRMLLHNMCNTCAGYTKNTTHALHVYWSTHCALRRYPQWLWHNLVVKKKHDLDRHSMVHVSSLIFIYCLFGVKKKFRCTVA